jgi:hypothetical protein
MIKKLSVRRRRPKPIVTAEKLWRSLCKEGGINVAWKRGKPLPSYDRALESKISKALFNDDSKPLASQLENSSVSATALLNAFFEALQPFSDMLHDIYEMLNAANASAQDKTLRVALKPKGLNQQLRATLEQFREWEEKFRAAAVRVLVSLWNADALWELRRVFADDAESWGRRSHEELWDSAYMSSAGFISPPNFQPTGEIAFDSAAAIAYETVDWFVKACRKLAADHKTLREAFDAAGGYSRVSREERDPDFDHLYSLAQAESDYWPVGMVVQIREARERLLGLPPTPRFAEAARINDNVTKLILDLPKSQALAGGFEKVISDIFRLPVWKQRSAVYSIWISTQIIAALAPRHVTFHPHNGELNFGFDGSRLATIATPDGDFALWSELRTILQSPTSTYRKRFIQPDYRIVSPGDPKDPASTRMVIECKQYKKPGTRNFTEAVNDYAMSCPRAVVLLVNYGPIGERLNALVELSLAKRVHFIEDFKPPSSTTLLKGLLQEVMPQTRWSEPGSVQLSWDAPLQDLDLHAAVSLADGVHDIWFRNSTDPVADVTLSADIQHGPGCETLSVHSWRGLRYEIFVHNYTGSTTLAGSGARVEVRIGKKSWQFQAPAEGDDPWWHVCTISPDEAAIAPVGRLLCRKLNYNSKSVS